MFRLFKKYLFLTAGALIAAWALEAFLIPNNIIDGGVVGVSIMISYLTSIELGLILVILNIPFVLFALKKLGKKFVFSTFYAVIVLAIGVTFVDNFVQAVTKDHLLAAVFGGIFLGIGVGVILRNNASLDGTEMFAMCVTKKSFLTVGQIIMSINVFIYIIAGFVYEWDSAMYSMLTYLVAYKIIDMVLDGLDEKKSITIIAEQTELIGNAIMKVFDKSVTYIKAKGGYSGEAKTLIYCIVTRFEVVKLKELVKEIDPKAFIAVENVHEVESVRFKKR